MKLEDVIDIKYRKDAVPAFLEDGKITKYTLNSDKLSVLDLLSNIHDIRQRIKELQEVECGIINFLDRQENNK